VTVATLVVIELLVLSAGLAALFGLAERLPPAITKELVQEVAPQLGPYLAGPSPDLEGVHRWLTDAGGTRIGSAPDGPDIVLRIDSIDLLQPDMHLLVLDRQGRVLGDIHQAQPPSVPVPLNVHRVPGLDDVLPRALAGETDHRRLYTMTSAGRLTSAVPIRDTQGTVVGALVVSTPLSPVPTILASSALVIAASALLFTLLVGLLGTLFGFLTARGFARRLRRVTTATTAWGEGDFAHTIRDRSQDEIGQLGRQLNAMALQLSELIETRQQLSAADERNRLARDLHDSVKQQLFAVNMHLGAAQALLVQHPAAARERLATAFELAQESQRELTTIIQTLRPVELEGRSLADALAGYVTRWQAQTGIAAVFEARDADNLPAPVEEALFRVAQEALANVARHSRAAQAQVALAGGTGETTLLVQDNGAGFDAGAPSQGLGLRSMRERLAAVGGTLRVDSGPAGTSVVARVPLTREGGR
jgi:NarL family two-component system sensor histidine kinase LiaS